MQIRVLFFGVLRDIVGLREDSVQVENGSRMAAVFEHYAGQFPKLRESAGSIVLARNQQFAALESELEEGDEVAFLPPVSGGSGPLPQDAKTGTRFLQLIEDPAGHFFALTRDPIDARALVDRLQQGCDGAVVTFEGVTRNNTKGRSTRYLDYECYEGMAVQMMAQIGLAIAGGDFPGGALNASGEPDPKKVISRIGIIHRLGRLEIGEASVVIVVASPHRKSAFDAAHEAIDRLKRLVPIWKKESFTDGEVWVEGEWDDSVAKAGPA